ncbi:MAG: thioredoxin family protein [Patescibacteria group bacterium]
MKTTLIALVALTLLSSCTPTTQKPIVPDRTNPSPMMDDKMMSGTDMMEEDTMMSGSIENPMMDDDMDKKMDDDMMSGTDMMSDDKMKPEAMMQKSTGYIEYDAAKVDAALASGQKVALFFHATWCPSCKALNTAITSNISAIPADTLIVKVDYDTSAGLKKKYRVVGQHTTVVLNADGTEKSKKLGARNIAEVLN